METTEPEFETTDFNATNSTFIPLSTTTTVDENSLPAGAIAGIVIGVFFGVLLIGILVYFLYKYRNRCFKKLKSKKQKSKNRSDHQVPYKDTSSQPNIRITDENIYLDVTEATLPKRSQTSRSTGRQSKNDEF